jgi:hypothetical protein
VNLILSVNGVEILVRTTDDFRNSPISLVSVKGTDMASSLVKIRLASAAPGVVASNLTWVGPDGQTGSARIDRQDGQPAEFEKEFPQSETGEVRFQNIDEKADGTRSTRPPSELSVKVPLADGGGGSGDPADFDNSALTEVSVTPIDDTDNPGLRRF